VYAQRASVEAVDKSQQTTQDYAIEATQFATNQDGTEATHEQLYDFFNKSYGEVAALTISRKNGNLLRLLADREVTKELYKRAKFKEQLFPGSNASTVNSHLSRMLDQNTAVWELLSKEYPIWRVYVVFNNQHDQVRCIKSLKNNRSNHLFNGSPVHIREAREPTDILYEISDRGFYFKLGSRLFSYFLSGTIIVASYFIINELLKNNNGFLTAIFISLINTLLPISMKYLTLSVEVHGSLESQQVSLLCKLVVVRCITSAILIFAATSYKETFTQEKLEAIFSTLLLTALLNPLLQLFDPALFFNQHILPRLTFHLQDELNESFHATEWTLAERYTDTIKMVFMSMFYAVILPSGLFIAAFTVLSTYLCDKYSMFNLWRRPPQVGDNIGFFARYFVVATLWGHLITSRYYFANWPYGGAAQQDTADQAKCNLFVCYINDDMTKDQKVAVILYSCLSTISFVVVAVLFLNRFFGKQILRFLGYDVSKKAEEIDEKKTVASFEVLQGTPIYIPFVSRPGLADAVICASTKILAEEYLPESVRHDTVYNKSIVDEDFPDLAHSDKVFGSARSYTSDSPKVHTYAVCC
jgi:RsiW-degrading membrane proteinase PrsW (M82 family)